MIPADIDPSLWSGAPVLQRLDDGFSPPPQAPQAEPPADNPTRLPVEPEFGQQVPPVEPEDPQAPPALQ